MRIVLITQDDPFYLGGMLEYLLSRIPSHSSVVGCILLDVSPSGRERGLWQQAWQTSRIFGIRFFLHYAFRFFCAKVFQRRSSVFRVLERYRVPVVEINTSVNRDESIRKIESLGPDLLVSVAANRIFKRRLLDVAPLGCLNLHTALLPKYRGLMPTFWVLKNDEKETGVTVFFMDEGIDSGPILIQKRIAVNGLSQAELIKVTKRMGMDALLESFDLVVKGEFTLQPNSDIEATYFSYPARHDVIEFLRKGKRFF
jgi:methionyl-tRNA formyltransferase